MRHIKTHCKQGHELTKENSKFYFRSGLKCRQCRICSREAVRRYNRNNVEKIQEANRHFKRLYNFGLTKEKWLTLVEKEGNKCGICGSEYGTTRDGKPCALTIDHDHSCCPGKTSCGKCIRGLLCHKCNSGLGMFMDNITLLVKAITYLTERSH